MENGDPGVWALLWVGIRSGRWSARARDRVGKWIRSWGTAIFLCACFGCSGWLVFLGAKYGAPWVGAAAISTACQAMECSARHMAMVPVASGDAARWRKAISELGYGEDSAQEITDAVAKSKRLGWASWGIEASEAASWSERLRRAAQSERKDRAAALAQAQMGQAALWISRVKGGATPEQASKMALAEDAAASVADGGPDPARLEALAKALDEAPRSELTGSIRRRVFAPWALVSGANAGDALSWAVQESKWEAMAIIGSIAFLGCAVGGVAMGATAAGLLKKWGAAARQLVESDKAALLSEWEASKINSSVEPASSKSTGAPRL